MRNLCLARTAAKLQVSARDREAAPDAFTVATFVPAQADICRLLNGQTAFDVRNILIGMHRANDLRIRNAWVTGFESSLRHQFSRVLSVMPRDR
jgi:hypothetical protein